MFETLVSINERPKPFEYYTIESLWNDEHTSEQMLKYHLNPEIDLSSRNTDFIDCFVEWIVSRFNVGRGTQIADFGCGPGLYTSRLAQNHASVTGIDISKRSIRYAQNMAEKDGQKIQYVNQNYLAYETEDRYGLIIMIMCDFCALGPQQRKILLSKFSNLLKSFGPKATDPKLNRLHEVEGVKIAQEILQKIRYDGHKTDLVGWFFTETAMLTAAAKLSRRANEKAGNNPGKMLKEYQ